jgi:hypothetical protein
MQEFADKDEVYIQGSETFASHRIIEAPRNIEDLIPFAPCKRREVDHKKHPVDNSTALREPLENLLSFGDILCVRGSGGLAQIGSTGGAAGHVLLVSATPTCIQKDSQAAVRLELMWPHTDVDRVWAIPIVESARGVHGLSETELLVYVTDSGSICILGEAHEDGGLIHFDSEVPEKVEIWRCPADLRRLARCTRDLMGEALDDLKGCVASWSFATAVRAFVLQGEVSMSARTVDTEDADATLQEILACWNAEPICTSVVICFWQRFLLHVAEQKPYLLFGSTALEVILQYMPLKADRVLPIELINTLRSHSWEHIDQVPFHKSIVTNMIVKC